MGTLGFKIIKKYREQNPNASFGEALKMTAEERWKYRGFSGSMRYMRDQMQTEKQQTQDSGVRKSQFEEVGGSAETLKARKKLAI